MKKNIVLIPDSYPTHCHDFLIFFFFFGCTRSPNLSWAINLQTIDIGLGIPLCSREVLVGTYTIQKKFQVWWEELAGWVASFSYHVVCCGFLQGLASCKVYLYMCDAFTWKRKLKNYTWCEWSILELTLISWRGVLPSIPSSTFWTTLGSFLLDKSSPS